MYVISLDEEFEEKVNVVQPEVKSYFEARLEALEKEVYKGSNPENKDDKSKKEKWAR